MNEVYVFTEFINTFVYGKMSFFRQISDRERSFCPKCHPYIAGCIVVVIFLFTMYHADDIKSFTQSIFRADSSPSKPSIATSKQFNTSNFNDTSNANAVVHFQTLSMLLLTLTMLPTIAMSHL